MSAGAEPPFNEHEEVRIGLGQLNVICQNPTTEYFYTTNLSDSRGTETVGLSRLTVGANQRHLLAEIVKASPVPTNVLLRIIQESHFEPRWIDIVPPHGMYFSTTQYVVQTKS